MKDTQQKTGAIRELLGAIHDSFTRESSARLTRLEDRLAQLRRWSILGTLGLLAYMGYQLWGEVGQELGSYQGGAEGVEGVVTDSAVDEARTSLFLIFAAALGGPIALLIGYIVLGFIYNVCHEALVRRVPLLRFFVWPVLLIAGVSFLLSHRAELKERMLEGYVAVERRIDSAKSLQRQARAAGERVREWRQMEAQVQALEDERLLDSAATPSAREGAGPSTPQPITQEEAVRRLGAVMLQLQGLAPPPSQPVGGQATAGQPPAPGLEPGEVPAAAGHPQASPSAPADI